jgi:hypothetical protein
MLEIQVLSLDRLNNVADLNLLFFMGYQPLFIIRSPMATQL